MTSKNDKLRGLFLAALMVFSVFAGTVALSGATAADRGGNNGPTELDDAWDKVAGAGNVGQGTTVFQGEGDITFYDNDGNNVQAENLERTAGSSEGEALEMPISEDAPTGTYSTNIDNPRDGFYVTVASPRISTFEITNTKGEDVSGGLLTTDSSGTPTVDIEYNFEEAEALDLSVTDEAGVDVTNEIVTGVSEGDGSNKPTGTATSTDGVVSFKLNPSIVDPGEYTISVEGSDDLTFGDASQSTTVEISDSQTASISVDDEQPTKGEQVTYTVSGTPEGSYHVVRIPESEFPGDSDDDAVESAFRNVGDVTDIDHDKGGAYAVVEIDGGDGVGRIDTSALDTTGVTVEVYPSGEAINNDGTLVTTKIIKDKLSSPDDDVDVDVQEGAVSIDNPTGQYVVGSEVSINGTTTGSADNVGIYVRDNGDWQYLTDISVDSDDTFEMEDVTISDSSGSLGTGADILSLEGTYRIGD